MISNSEVKIGLESPQERTQTRGKVSGETSIRVGMELKKPYIR